MDVFTRSKIKIKALRLTGTLWAHEACPAEQCLSPFPMAVRQEEQIQVSVFTAAPQ